MKKEHQDKYLVEAKGPEISKTATDLMRERKQKYLMINVLARRARDLNRGSRCLAEKPKLRTLSERTIAEVGEGKLDLIRKEKSTVMVSLINNE